MKAIGCFHSHFLFVTVPLWFASAGMAMGSFGICLWTLS